MKKRTKISLVLSSAAAILLAGSIMAGGTYALFTSESKTNIAVNSGKVDVSATVENLQTYSGKDLTGDEETDADKIYKTNSEELGGENGTFANKGTAKYNEGTLTLDKMTPGDKVTFDINITNNSNVAIKYCIKITSSNDNGLFNGLEVKIPDHSVNGDIVWKSLAYDATNTSITNIEGCSISLPSTASNDYQDKKCDITISVEAVQGNAKTEDTHYIHSENELKNCLATVKEGSNIVLSDDISLTYGGNNSAGTPDTYLCAENVTIDLNGKTITTNIPDGNPLYALSIAANNVTLKNGKILAGVNSSNNTISYSLQITAGSQNATLEDLEITGGVFVCGYSTTAIIRNCKITATNYYDIYSVPQTTVTIESGEFIPATGKVHFYMETANDSIILNGGTFADNTCYYSGSGTLTNNVSTITATKR